MSIKTTAFDECYPTEKSRITVRIKKLKSTAQVPKYAHTHDVGFDLHASESYVLQPGSTVLISTGLAFELPVNYEIQVRPRSGLSLKTNLRVSNAPGTIDPNFRAELKIILQNTGDTLERVELGDRIAQGVIAPIYRADFDLVEQLNETDRQGGFGSSGLK